MSTFTLHRKLSQHRLWPPFPWLAAASRYFLLSFLWHCARFFSCKPFIAVWKLASKIPSETGPERAERSEATELPVYPWKYSGTARVIYSWNYPGEVRVIYPSEFSSFLFWVDAGMCVCVYIYIYYHSSPSSSSSSYWYYYYYYYYSFFLFVHTATQAWWEVGGLHLGCY